MWGVGEKKQSSNHSNCGFGTTLLSQEARDKKSRTRITLRQKQNYGKERGYLEKDTETSLSTQGLYLTLGSLKLLINKNKKAREGFEKGASIRAGFTTERMLRRKEHQRLPQLSLEACSRAE